MASKDRRYFFAVGQKSFEAGATASHFSTVVPIADTSGKLIEKLKSEFPTAAEDAAARPALPMRRRAA